MASLEVVLTHARTVLFVEYSALIPSSQNSFSLAFVGLTRSGYEAVMVFFILSGFLVGGRAMDLAREGKFNAFQYAVDRAVRILVPLSAAIVLAVIVSHLINKPIAPLDVAGNLLSLQGVFVEPLHANYALWTLSYEVWFYILGGAVAFMVSARKLMLVPVLLLLAGAFVFTRLNPLYALLWIGGAGCYFYRPKRVVRWHVVVAVLVVIAGVAVFQIAGLPRGSSEVGDPMWQVIAGALIFVGMAILIPVGRMAPSPGAQVAPFLASFSYSLYLVHYPLLYVVPVLDMREVNVATMGLYCAVVLAIMIFAFAFSRVFETTAPKLKAYLAIHVQSAMRPRNSRAGERGGGR